MSETAPRVARIRIPRYAEQVSFASAALERGELVYGPHLEQVEAWLCERYGKRHALLTANGFSAIFLALKAAGVDEGPVITPAASTCFAIVHAIQAAGATPLFRDLEPDTASLGPAPGAPWGDVCVVPDHFGIVAGACKAPGAAGRLLIEDAAMAALSRAHVPTQADAVVLSFYAAKQVNGIDGGALLTDDDDLARTARRLRYYGDQYAHEEGGRFNLKLNNVNAAYLLGTLEHWDAMTGRLRELYARLAGALDRLGIPYLRMREGEVATRLMLVAEDAQGKRRWAEALTARGVEVSDELVMLCPPDRAGDHPVAQRLVSTSLSIPFHPALEDAEVAIVLEALEAL